MSKIKVPKQSCFNCHFLVKLFVPIIPISTDEHKLSWDDEDKATFQPRDPGGGYAASECYRKFWSTRVAGYERDLKEVVLQNRRKDGCFFKDRREDGIVYKAALELANQKKEKLEKRSEKRKDILLKVILPILTSLIASLIGYLVGSHGK